jgi:hypothetical protein
MQNTANVSPVVNSKMISTTNERFKFLENDLGVFTLYENEKIFYFDGNLGWVQSTKIQNIEVDNNIFTFHTLNSIYVFEIFEELRENYIILNNANKLIQLKEKFWKEIKSSNEVRKFGLFYGIEHIMKDDTLVFAKNKIFEKHDKITDKVIRKLDKELKNKYDVICDDLEDYENWEIRILESSKNNQF